MLRFRCERRPGNACSRTCSSVVAQFVIFFQSFGTTSGARRRVGCTDRCDGANSRRAAFRGTRPRHVAGTGSRLASRLTDRARSVLPALQPRASCRWQRSRAALLTVRSQPLTRPLSPCEGPLRWGRYFAVAFLGHGAPAAGIGRALPGEARRAGRSGSRRAWGRGRRSGRG